jgi:hypothetical protein
MMRWACNILLQVSALYKLYFPYVVKLPHSVPKGPLGLVQGLPLGTCDKTLWIREN